MGDLYEVLGIRRDASADDIKRAYRRLAREFHPDANPGDQHAAARFREVAGAYEVLADPRRRDRYDRYGTTDDFDIANPFGSGPGGLGDLFDAFFGGSSPFGSSRPDPRAPQRGPDLRASITLDLSEVVTGIQRDLTYRTAVTCEDCGGSGSQPGTTVHECPDCGGTGEIRSLRQTVLGQIVSTAPCRRCEGRGEIMQAPCGTCGAEGRLVRDVTITTDVPPGVDNGTVLRHTGRGAVGVRGGPPGDLYVEIAVRAHPTFERDGIDLIEHRSISPSQAALGARLLVETIDVPEDLLIPPGTQSGTVLAIKGRGVPRLNGRGRGRHLVVLDVRIPEDLTDEEEELYRRLAGIRQEEVGMDQKFREWIRDTLSR
ncbi:MAG: DnaJ C-terminal domain-containing protein [Actinomycetota bacterium]